VEVDHLLEMQAGESALASVNYHGLSLHLILPMDTLGNHIRYFGGVRNEDIVTSDSERSW
jgi:hypothetical protein